MMAGVAPRAAAGRTARRLTAAFAVALVASALASCGAAAPGSLPTDTLPALGGAGALDPATLRDEVTVVNVWATWCAPCRDELPVLQAAHEERSSTVRVVGVNLDREPAAAQALLDELGVAYEQYSDPDGLWLAALDLPGLPATVVVDRDGSVVERHLGVLDEATLASLIDRASD